MPRQGHDRPDPARRDPMDCDQACGAVGSTACCWLCAVTGSPPMYSTCATPATRPGDRGKGSWATPPFLSRRPQIMPTTEALRKALLAQARNAIAGALGLPVAKAGCRSRLLPPSAVRVRSPLDFAMVSCAVVSAASNAHRVPWLRTCARMPSPRPARSGRFHPGCRRIRADRDRGVTSDEPEFLKPDEADACSTQSSSCLDRTA